MGFEILEKINNIPNKFTIEEKYDKDSYIVAKVVKNKDHAFVKLDKKGKPFLKIDIDDDDNDEKIPEIRFEPWIPYKIIERLIIFIFGASGKGKTLIAGEIVKQYKELYKGRVFYICSTKIEDDRTLKGISHLITQIDASKICNKKTTEEDMHEILSQGFKNSLVIFDDNDMNKNAKTSIFPLRDHIIEKGRKYNISCCFISHKNCDSHNTRMLLNEISIYVTYKNKILKNRLLNTYYGFEDKFLKDVKNSTKSFAWFNFAYEKIVTPYYIKDFSDMSEE